MNSIYEELNQSTDNRFNGGFICCWEDFWADKDMARGLAGDNGSSHAMSTDTGYADNMIEGNI